MQRLLELRYMLKPFWKDKNRFWVTFDKEDADGTPMADTILQTVEKALTDYDRAWCEDIHPGGTAGERRLHHRRRAGQLVVQQQLHPGCHQGR